MIYVTLLLLRIITPALELKENIDCTSFYSNWGITGPWKDHLFF